MKILEIIGSVAACWLVSLAAATDNCDVATSRLKCDGVSDDTAALQAALDACSELVLPPGKTCITFPLKLRSNLILTIPSNATLKAGASVRWPNVSETRAFPLLTAPEGTNNLTIRGDGTIDGSGAQWWTGSNASPRRPHMLTLPGATNVLLEDFLMLNSADFHAELHGSHYRVFGIRIRSPDYKRAPNTDGIDIQGNDYHIRGVDVTNGDDSICIKSPSRDVLVEGSIVRQGNGLVVGTGSHTNITNIMFRNCTAIRTAFGCHIKFKDDQKGKPGVTNVTFQDINIILPTKYAIGIDQNGQGRRQRRRRRLLVESGSDVPINNITYRRIRAQLQEGKKTGGRFTCNPGPRLSCRGIVFEDVDLGDDAECQFQNVYGQGSHVRPLSCVPPPPNRSRSSRSSSSSSSSSSKLRLLSPPPPPPTQPGNNNNISDPPWPGGAFPPLPWAPNWQLRDAVAGFFLGNTSGGNSAAETEREASLGVVGLGWQLGVHDSVEGGGGHWAAPGGLEQRQREAARAIKSLRPSVRVLVSAEIDATCALWAASDAAMANASLARRVFMTRPNGSLWLDRRYAGLFDQPWYNWSSPAAVQWWIDRGPIAAAMADPYIDGVYLDGADPDPAFYRDHFAEDPAGLRAFQGAQRAALALAVATWRRRRPDKWLGGYAAPRVRGGGAQQANHCPPGSCAGPEQLRLAGPEACAATMRLLISRSGWTNQTTVIAIPKKEPAAPWVPLATWDCAPPWWDQERCRLRATRDPSPEVGAFLVVRGPSALLQVAMQPDHTVDYRDPARFPSLLLDPGARPLGPAQETRPGVFERRWSKLDVRFDCGSYTANFSPITGGGEEGAGEEEEGR